MDFIERFPMTNGKDNIFVMVDKLTKYAHLIAIKTTYSTKHIAHVLCKNIYK